MALDSEFSPGILDLGGFRGIPLVSLLTLEGLGLAFNRQISWRGFNDFLCGHCELWGHPRGMG